MKLFVVYIPELHPNKVSWKNCPPSWNGTPRPLSELGMRASSQIDFEKSGTGCIPPQSRNVFIYKLFTLSLGKNQFVGLVLMFITIQQSSCLLSFL